MQDAQAASLHANGTCCCGHMQAKNGEHLRTSSWPVLRCSSLDLRVGIIPVKLAVAAMREGHLCAILQGRQHTCQLPLFLQVHTVKSGQHLQECMFGTNQSSTSCWAAVCKI